MDTDDCITCVVKLVRQQADVWPVVGQLELPFSKRDRKLMELDHRQVLEERFPTIRVAGLD